MDNNDFVTRMDDIKLFRLMGYVGLGKPLVTNERERIALTIDALRALADDLDGRASNYAARGIGRT